ncbi:MAG TPA: hypothetical protein VER39_03870, partial [Nocardioidaceae bacterium]|nr:hypothetical protein [Nocardioidaceae bacterium]
MTVRGVRSSWLVSCRNSRCAVKAVSSRPSMSLNAAAICEASSRRETGMRRLRSVSEICRAVDASSRRGRRMRPDRPR